MNNVVVCAYCGEEKEYDNTDFILWRDKHFENCKEYKNIFNNSIKELLKAIFLQLDSYNLNQEQKLKMREESRELFNKVNKVNK